LASKARLVDQKTQKPCGFALFFSFGQLGARKYRYSPAQPNALKANWLAFNLMFLLVSS
jgi:hypothetical protein